jgi:hypothetical protein
VSALVTAPFLSEVRIYYKVMPPLCHKVQPCSSEFGGVGREVRLDALRGDTLTSSPRVHGAAPETAA